MTSVRSSGSAPKEPAFDSSLQLLTEGNVFIFRRCQKYQSDIFQVRLLGKKTLCITGQEAAQEFYQEGRFIRRGAIPSSVLRLLQDKGSVATLDGPEHHWRKQLFMSLMQPQAIERLADIVEELWLAALNQWKTKDEIIFLDEVEKILLHAVCIWTGIPLTKADIIQRTKEISAMIEGAGAVGPKNWKGIWLRRKTERWARHLINQSRAATPTMNASVLSKVAHHRTAKGELLSSEVAAVELLNILRPTVAIGRYGLFAALALHQFPACRNEIVEKNNSEYIHYYAGGAPLLSFFPLSVDWSMRNLNGAVTTLNAVSECYWIFTALIMIPGFCK